MGTSETLALAGARKVNFSFDNFNKLIKFFFFGVEQKAVLM